MEVIVVDDHSPTALTCPDGVELLRNEENLGAPASRNRGARHAEGEYLCFLDNDDTLRPEKIEKQLKKFEEVGEDIGVVTCDVAYHRSDIKEVKKNRARGDIYEDILKSYVVHGTLSMLIRRDVFEEIGGFDPDLPANQEYDLMIRLAEVTKFDYIPEVLADVYEGDDQISFNFDKKVRATKMLWEKHEDRFKRTGTYAYNWFRFSILLFVFWFGKLFGKTPYSYLRKIV